MRKSKLMRKNEDFIRVLAVDGDDVFYFSCQGIKSLMPKWGKASDLEMTDDECKNLTYTFRLFKAEKLE